MLQIFTETPAFWPTEAFYYLISITQLNYVRVFMSVFFVHSNSPYCSNRYLNNIWWWLIDFFLLYCVGLLRSCFHYIAYNLGAKVDFLYRYWLTFTYLSGLSITTLEDVKSIANYKFKICKIFNV